MIKLSLVKREMQMKSMKNDNNENKSNLKNPFLRGKA